MSTFASCKSSIAAAAAIVLLLGSAAVTAGTPSDVSDLVGARGAGGEMELGQRGYSYVTMCHGTQYWWNAERKACIGIKVAQGHYKSVSSASASHCHQSAEAAAGSSSPHQGKVDVEDLKVGSEMGAERELEKRGFQIVDGGQSGMFSNLWFYHPKTGQCLQLETADGKVMTLNEVSNPKCR
jgi:hypothetical protein